MAILKGVFFINYSIIHFCNGKKPNVSLYNIYWQTQMVEHI